MSDLPDRVTGGYRLALGGCCVLLLFATLPLMLQPNASTGQWLMHALPLVLLMPGLARGRRRNLQWLGFVVLFVLTLGVLQSFTPDPRLRVVGLLNIAGSTVLFIIVIVTSRLESTRSRESSP